MNSDGWTTVAVIAAMIVAMAGNAAGPDLVLMGGLTVLLLLGIVEPSEAFAGFSNPAIVAIGALYVVAAAVRETGAMDYAARVVLGRPRNTTGAQLRMMLPVAAISAFLNNTPVVAMFVPLVTDWAKRSKISASLLLMPLSYAAILGGSCTLIGTSTNLVVAGMAQERVPGIQLPFFEIAWIGIPVLVVGTAFILVASRRLLRDRVGALTTLGKPREYTIATRVEHGSPVIGKTIEAAGLRSLEGVYLFEIERDGLVLTVVSPNTVLRENDRLFFTGIVESVVDLRKMRIMPDSSEDGDANDDGPVSRRRPLVEAVVSARSELIGQTVRDSRFRARFNSAILAVHRQGIRITQKVGDIRLQPADVLLLETKPNFVERRQHDPNFALVSAVENSAHPRYERGWISTSILLAMVVVNACGWMSLSVSALAAAFTLWLTRCISSSQVRSAIEYNVIIAIAAALGIAAALEQSGAAQALAHQLLSIAQPFGTTGTLVALYAVTAVLAGVVSTKAAAALMFPIALSVAQAQSLPVVAISYLVMVAASTAFGTPIGYQTNLMVYGPGGYRYTDFIRLGVPLQIIVGVVAIAVIQWRWIA